MRVILHMHCSNPIRHAVAHWVPPRSLLPVAYRLLCGCLSTCLWRAAASHAALAPCPRNRAGAAAGLPLAVDSKRRSVPSLVLNKTLASTSWPLLVHLPVTPTGSSSHRIVWHCSYTGLMMEIGTRSRSSRSAPKQRPQSALSRSTPAQALSPSSCCRARPCSAALRLRTGSQNWVSESVSCWHMGTSAAALLEPWLVGGLCAPCLVGSVAFLCGRGARIAVPLSTCRPSRRLLRPSWFLTV